MISRGLLSLFTTVNNHWSGLPPQEKHPPSWDTSLWRHPATIGYLKKTTATSQVARAKFSFTIFNVTTAGTVTSMPSWQVSLMKQNQGFAWPQLNETCSKIQHIYIFTSIHILFISSIPNIQLYFFVEKTRKLMREPHLKGLHRGAIGHLKITSRLGDHKLWSFMNVCKWYIVYTYYMLHISCIYVYITTYIIDILYLNVL